ncbi:MAG: DNA repair protein RecN [Pseudomonadota bacterium]
MLRSLDIRDMLIVDKLSVDFQPGLNVLTGETGAGKSILLESIGFVLGWRGRADLVRQGAERGEVSAVFDLAQDHEVLSLLQTAGYDVSDELILRRINFSDGRKQAFINDRRASGETLRAVSEKLIEIHGQHDERGLLNAQAHRGFLDQFAGIDPLPLRESWKELSKEIRLLKEFEAVLEAARQEEEYLRHAALELGKLAPVPGEEQQLDTQRRLMQAGQKIREDIVQARALLGADGAEGNIGDAMRWLDRVADKAEQQLDSPLAALGRSLSALGEAVDDIEACLTSLSFDPHELEQVEERLFALRALARKHGVLPDELADLADQFAEKVTSIDTGQAELQLRRNAVSEAQARYDSLALAISQARETAAQKLDAAMQAELATLKMERAVFTTGISQTDPGPTGRDAVVFSVATNPGAPSGPLSKIASGGELSRFLLALKVCLIGSGAHLTMIFDEIDRGVGGATADAVGRRLVELAKTAQLLIVTHSPQVAALGAHHWRVEKRIRGEMTISTVLPLSKDARIDEIARMVSGDTVTEAAKDAARALLKG